MKKTKYLALFLGLTLLVGCAPNAPARPAKAPTVLRYGLSGAWDSLMPYNSVSGSNYARIVYDKIYDRLAYVHADGSLTPRAAVSWESADGGEAVLFHLDEKAAFHDGTPVTAEHWVTTFRLMTDPNCPTLGRVNFNVFTGTDEEGRALRKDSVGAEAVDAYTLKLCFKDPTTPEDFLRDKNREFYVLPTHLLQGVAPGNLMTQELWRAPVGSGPCRFVSQLAGSELTLSANEAYQLGTPGFDRLVMTVMDKSNLLTALIAGDLDYYAFGGNVSAEDAALATKSGLSVIEGTVPNSFYELMVNNAAIPGAELRRALEYALDKERLCQQSTAGLGEVTGTSILPDSPYYPGKGETGQNVAEAEKLLEAAGYKGERYTLACTANRAGLAALMQQQWAEAGIAVEIETVDSASVFAGMSDGKYDLAIASHTPGLTPLWFTESRFSDNNNIFHVPDVAPYQDYLHRIQTAGGSEARKAEVAQFEGYLAAERPFLPLWFGKALHVQSPTVRGIDYASSSFSNENVWDWVK